MQKNLFFLKFQKNCLINKTITKCLKVGITCDTMDRLTDQLDQLAVATKEAKFVSLTPNLEKLCSIGSVN